MEIAAGLYGVAGATGTAAVGSRLTAGGAVSQGSQFARSLGAASEYNLKVDQVISRSAAKYPNVTANRGSEFPSGVVIGVVDRAGAAARRVSNIKKSGLKPSSTHDRVDSTPAVVIPAERSRRAGTSVNYEPRRENRSDGGKLRHELKGVKNGSTVVFVTTD